MIRLTQGEKVLELPALEPSDALLYAYHSAELICNLIDRGDLKSTKEDADRWMDQHPDNRVKFAAAKQLMSDYPISDYKKAFQHRYIRELDAHPEGRASHVIAKEHVQRGWALLGLDPDLIVALSK